MCQVSKSSPWQWAWRSRWVAGVSPCCYLTSCDKIRLDIWIAVPGTARSPLLAWQMLQLVIVITANCWHGFVSPTHLHQVCVFFERKWLAYFDTKSPMESGQSQRQLCPTQVLSHVFKLQSKCRLYQSCEAFTIIWYQVSVTECHSLSKCNICVWELTFWEEQVFIKILLRQQMDCGWIHTL